MAGLQKRSWIRNGRSRTAWRVSWYDEAGGRHFRQFATRAAAARFRAELEHALDRGTWRQAGADMGLTEAAEAWLEILERGRDGEGPIARATRTQYVWALEHWILPELGRRRLAELDAPTLIAYRDKLLATRLSRGSAARVWKVLRACLREAARRGWLAVDPLAGGVVTIKGARRKPKVEIPSRDQVRALLNQAQAWAELEDPRRSQAWRRGYALLATAALTGLRQQELRALAWGAVDFEAGLVRVERAADQWGTIKETKTAASERAVELEASLARILKAWKLAAPAARPEGLVFGGAGGGVMDKGNLYHRTWRRARDAAGLPAFPFHSLRHFYASTLIAAGATPKEVQSAMGHASITITFDCYGHLFPEDRAARRARVERLARDLLG